MTVDWGGLDPWAHAGAHALRLHCSGHHDADSGGEMVPSGPWEPGSLCPEPLTTLHLDDRGWGPDSAPSEQNWSLGVGQASDTLRAEAGPAGRRLPQEAHCVAGEHEGDGWGPPRGPCPDAPARLKICSLFRVSWLHSACRKWHQCTSVLHTRKTITPAPRAHARVWTVSLCSPRDPWGSGLFLPQNPRPVSQCGRNQKTHGRLARQGPSSERPLSRESASPWRCRPPPLPQRGCLRRPPSAAPGGSPRRACSLRLSRRSPARLGSRCSSGARRWPRSARGCCRLGVSERHTCPDPRCPGRRNARAGKRREALQALLLPAAL